MSRKQKIRKLNADHKNVLPEEGFMAYALEFKRKLCEKNFGDYDMKEVVQMAKPHWEKLINSEKHMYRNLCIEPEISNSRRKSKRRNCQGALQLEKEIDKENYDKITREINELVTQAGRKLDDLVFTFIDSKAFIENEDDIFPAEIALAKFSLKKGIFDDLQIRINPGELPMGSAYQASEHAKKYHNYPLPPNCDGESDYLSVLESILKFLHPFDKLPIFFTEGNWRDDKKPLQTARKIVEKILYESQEDDLIDDVKIYPVDELFSHLQGMNLESLNNRYGYTMAKWFCNNPAMS